MCAALNRGQSLFPGTSEQEHRQERERERAISFSAISIQFVVAAAMTYPMLFFLCSLTHSLTPTHIHRVSHSLSPISCLPACLAAITMTVDNYSYCPANKQSSSYCYSLRSPLTVGRSGGAALPQGARLGRHLPIDTRAEEEEVDSSPIP